MRTLSQKQTMNTEPRMDIMTLSIKIISANPEKASSCLRILPFWYQRIYTNQLSNVKEMKTLKKLFFAYTQKIMADTKIT